MKDFDLKKMSESATPESPVELVLMSDLSSGDGAVMSATVRSLHDCYPGRFKTDVKVSDDNQVFIGNPLITPVDQMSKPIMLEMHYPAINQSNQRELHFMVGYLEYLGSKLGLPLRLTHFRPDIYMTDEEKQSSPISDPYWLVIGGGKPDYGTKLWPANRFQDVIDMLKNDVRFVQAGILTHSHPPLCDAIDVRGQTTLRQLMQLVYHSNGVLCPVTCAMHFAAGFNKPCVVVAYAGEAEHWEAYTAENRIKTMQHFDPNWKPEQQDDFIPHTYLRGVPLRDCVDHNGWGCWRSKITTGEIRERCRWLHNENGNIYAGCLESVYPEDVARAVLNYERGSVSVEVSEKPTIHVFANMGCQGGGEQSTVTMMSNMKKDFRVEFWSLNNIHSSWKSKLFRYTDSTHQKWDKPDIKEGDHVFFYMNDYPTKFRSIEDDWKNWLQPAESVQIGINYIGGGLEKLEWLGEKTTAVYFLNSTKMEEWKKKINPNSAWYGVPTVVLPPATDLSRFDGIKKNSNSERLVIGRLGGSASKLPDDSVNFYKSLAREIPNAEFWFMPEPPLKFGELRKNPRFRFLRRNEISVEEFLEKCDIFAYPLNPKVKDQGPRVIMEAMRAGCVVVAENRDGAKDRIENGVSGVLCDNHEEMIKEIVDLSYNESRRLEMSKLSIKRSKEWDVSSWSNSIKNHTRGKVLKDSPVNLPADVKTKTTSEKNQYLFAIRGGQGLGNIVECIPAIRALSTMGDVDVWMVNDYREILEGQDFVRSVSANPEDLPVYLNEYTAIVPQGYFTGMPGLIAKNVVPQQKILMYQTPEALANIARVRHLGFRGEAPYPDLNKPPKSTMVPKNYVVVGACCKTGDEWKRKRYPHYEKVARMVKDKYGGQIVFVGVLSESQPWMSSVGIDLCGKTSFSELTSILANAELFVGNDCGPAHLSAAYNVPTCVLFGPTNDRKNAPYSKSVRVMRSSHKCQSCQGDSNRWKSCDNWECINSIDATDVYEKVSEMLGDKMNKEAKCEDSDIETEKNVVPIVAETMSIEEKTDFKNMDWKERVKHVGILLTSHPKQQMFWKAGIHSWDGWSGGPIVLAYDDIDIDPVPMGEFSPPITHVVCSGLPAGKLGHPKGELRLMQLGINKLKELGCEYFFKSAADTATPRFYGFKELFRLLDENDVDFVHDRLNAIFGKTDRLVELMSTFDPSENIKVAEGWFDRRKEAIGITHVGKRHEEFWLPVMGRLHLQGDHALSHEISVRDTWKNGEIWPRGVENVNQQTDVVIEIHERKKEPEILKKQLIVTGSGRSGTLGITKMISEVLGIKAKHQPYKPIRLDKQIVMSNLDDPDKNVKIGVQRIIENTPVDEAFLAADWSISQCIYEASRAEEFPESARFAVLLRNPVHQANSLMNFRSRSDQDHELGIDYYMNCWIRLNLMLCEQVERMEEKPFLILFERYIKGDYNRSLVEYFGVEYTNVLELKMNTFLKRKVNSRGEYEMIQCTKSKMNIAMSIRDRLIDVCDSWGVSAR